MHNTWLVFLYEIGNYLTRNKKNIKVKWIKIIKSANKISRHTVILVFSREAEKSHSNKIDDNVVQIKLKSLKNINTVIQK